MDSVQKENIANHIAAISEQLVTLLAFVYELITKCPFRSDSAYRQEDYCYESRLLMRKMDSNYRRKRFFEGRVKTVRRNRRGTSELEKAIDKFH